MTLNDLERRIALILRYFTKLAVSSCYWKIFNVKSNENVRLRVDMFNCDDVATLLTKRKHKFAGSFARIDSILCELVVVISD